MPYQWAAADEIEPIAADTIAAIANIADYNVVSGCDQTYSVSNMEKAIAAGEVTHNGTATSVAGNTVTLVSDPSNPRFTITGIDDTGTAEIIQGDPAAIPAVPELGDDVMIGLDLVQAGQTIANNIVTKLDKRVSGDLSLVRYSEAVSTVAAAGATETINLNNGPVHDITLDENVTFTFSNPVASGRASSFTLILRQDGSGTNTVTWPASVKWAGGIAPTITADANAIDVLTFVTVTGGTEWLGFVAGQAMAVPA